MVGWHANVCHHPVMVELFNVSNATMCGTLTLKSASQDGHCNVAKFHHVWWTLKLRLKSSLEKWFHSDSAQVHPRRCSAALLTLERDYCHHQPPPSHPRHETQLRPTTQFAVRGNRIPAACLSASVTAHVLRKQKQLTYTRQASQTGCR